MNPLIKVALRYGVLAGIIGAGLLIGLYYMGRHPLLIPVYADFRIIIFVVFILFALRELRYYHQDGILYFWQGIIGSFLLTVCFATVALLALMLFMHFVPEFLSEYIRLETDAIKSLPAEVIDRIGKGVYEEKLRSLPDTSAAALALTYFVQSFIISFFISVILSVTLRRQPKT